MRWIWVLISLVGSVAPAVANNVTGPDGCYECLSTPSNPPAPSGREGGESEGGQIASTQKGHPTDDKRGTPDAPFLVKVLDPPDAQAKAAQDAADRNTRTAKEEWDWRFNFLLVCVGVGQGVVLTYTAPVSNKAANAAKQAAETAERTLTELERPWIFVDISGTIEFKIICGKDAESRIVPIGFGRTEFTIFNHGKSPAWVAECYVGASTSRNPAGIAVIRQDMLRSIGPGQSCSTWAEFDPRVDNTVPESNDVDHIVSYLKGGRDEDIFVYIHAKYTGIRTTPIYESHFCWRWDESEPGWVIYDDADYNRRT